MEILLKGILGKLFKGNETSPQPAVQSISQAEVEALVEAKIKEHAATLENTRNDLHEKQPSAVEEEYRLSSKQVEYALSLIDKIKSEFDLAIDPSNLTIKDLNRLIAYNRYKNKGTLVNLVKKGVLRKR
ncbi:ABC transporter ATP-binding protein [Neobacillus sp. OS1-2]|uniref:ABC transporter ATP-binding protein n=1 Tax=Neobacillus sp. OS1-2 TaxID=3070680 RepID=UPI0027E16064|nr:ABC transporter ATP-binding protein [Neobacillus sp. OS1-2]WML39610.1 ABC transporter ATP-binding protein [Neobacillus sp. OS1-2]